MTALEMCEEIIKEVADGYVNHETTRREYNLARMLKATIEFLQDPDLPDYCPKLFLKELNEIANEKARWALTSL